YGITVVAWLFLLAQVGLVAGLASGRTPWARPWIPLVAGFVLSSAFHFAVYRNPAVSWQYLLLDFKMIYARKSYYGTASIWIYLTELFQAISTNPEPFVVYAASGALLIALARRRKAPLPRGIPLALVALGILALGNQVIGTRPGYLRDLLWTETLLRVLSAVQFLLAIRYAEPVGRRRLGAIVATIVCAAISIDAVHAASMPRAAAEENAGYGWRGINSVGGGYLGNQ